MIYLDKQIKHTLNFAVHENFKGVITEYIYNEYDKKDPYVLIKGRVLINYKTAKIFDTNMEAINEEFTVTYPSGKYPYITLNDKDYTIVADGSYYLTREQEKAIASLDFEKVMKIAIWSKEDRLSQDIPQDAIEKAFELQKPYDLVANARKQTPDCFRYVIPKEIKGED